MTETKSSEGSGKRGVLPLVWGALLGVTLAGVLIAGLSLWFGSLTAAMAFADGRVLFADEPVKRIALPRELPEVGVVFSITNVSTSPVKLLGASTGCSCVESTGALPAVLGSGDSIDLTFTVRREFRPDEELAVERVKVYTDTAGLSQELMIEMVPNDLAH